MLLVEESVFSISTYIDLFYNLAGLSAILMGISFVTYFLSTRLLKKWNTDIFKYIGYIFAIITIISLGISLSFVY